jgi:integrase/recombinase XerC
MVQTGVLAGPRVSELCNLEVTDVDLVGAVLNIRDGKGGKDRNVPIGRKLLVVLREWIGQRRKGFLFPGPKGRQLKKRAFQLRLTALAKAAKILKATHPHLLRHSFATLLVKKGVNLRIIQTLLGHGSVAVTEIYTHIDTSDLKPAVDLL